MFAVQKEVEADLVRMNLFVGGVEALLAAAPPRDGLDKQDMARELRDLAGKYRELRLPFLADDRDRAVARAEDAMKGIPKSMQVARTDDGSAAAMRNARGAGARGGRASKATRMRSSRRRKG